MVRTTMVRTTAWQMARTTARQNPRSRCRQLRGWLDGATSVAAGGPSAAMPTATVRRGVPASDDRKRKTMDFDGAVHRVNNAPELDNCAVAGALDDAPMVDREGRIDQVAAERPQPRQNPVLVGSGKPRIADDVGHQDRCEFPGLAHGANAEVASSPVSGVIMAALPCCTDETRRPGMQARRSVISLAALARCVGQTNAENNS